MITSNFSSFKEVPDSWSISYNKATLNVQSYANKFFRLRWSQNKTFNDIPSFACTFKPSKKGITAIETASFIEFTLDETILHIEKSTGEFNCYTKTNPIPFLVNKNGPIFNKNSVSLRFECNKETRFYGLGEKTGFLDKRGRTYTMWNTDEPNHEPLTDQLYKSIPILYPFLHGKSCGLFFDNPCKSQFHLDPAYENIYTVTTFDSEIDCIILPGDTLKNAVQQFGELTGKIALPPKWSLGYQQCRYSYHSSTEAIEIAQEFRTRKIPCDVIYLDIHHMEGFRVFTWDRDNFSDPEQLLSTLHQMGFKVITITDPGVKTDPEYDVYVDGLKKDVFCKTIDNQIYKGEVWPGESVYPDFTTECCKEYWAYHQGKNIALGLDGIWNDMNEPSDFSQGKGSNDKTLRTVPNHVIMNNNGYPRTFEKYHNIYGFAMCQATMQAFEKTKPICRPFIVTRSAYAGIQRYAAVWTGDNAAYWEHLRMSIAQFCNIGLSGIPFVGGDVGGFQKDTSPELFARWMQLGAFTPFFRSHTAIDTKAHEPWCFGSKVEEITKKYIQLRYMLLPYWYSCFYDASKTALPIMRPLVLNYPEDKNTENIQDQCMIGNSILIAPVCFPDERKRCVYLPEGNWYNFKTNEKHEGLNYIIADAPLEDMPIFIKAGSIIPTQNVVQYVDEKEITEITLTVYPGNDCSFELYEDDGSTLSSSNSVTVFSWNQETQTLHFSKQGDFISSIQKYFVKTNSSKLYTIEKPLNNGSIIIV